MNIGTNSSYGNRQDIEFCLKDASFAVAGRVRDILPPFLTRPPNDFFYTSASLARDLATDGLEESTLPISLSGQDFSALCQSMKCFSHSQKSVSWLDSEGNLEELIHMMRQFRKETIWARNHVSTRDWLLEIVVLSPLYMNQYDWKETIFFSFIV
ncbi:hypothetical protein CEXT_478061 [Caerostris extrusa]|uniref:Uncharacterized protein n=1 Tax=Caerostris extrusa TaxID=172846 RepID=A0AAV4TM69_CAEEX|nr:hypothetical protein CEXT_478061 [Caerostris extrusa]